MDRFLPCDLCYRFSVSVMKTVDWQGDSPSSLSSLPLSIAPSIPPPRRSPLFSVLPGCHYAAALHDSAGEGSPISLN